MKFINFAMYLNRFRIGLYIVLIATIIMMSIACTTVSETFMQDDSTIYFSENTDKELREVFPLDGGQINIAMPLDPLTFNPLKNQNINMINIFSLVFESPLKQDIDGSIKANLVENWNYDSTGMIWTFYLRKNIMWHNGLGELTAEDMVYTLDLIMDYTSQESVYARYNRRVYDYYAQDKYTFVIEAQDPTINSNDKESIPSPSYYIEHLMTFPVMCKEYYENTEDINISWPIGTGPYEFISYKTKEGIRLDVNDDWWKNKPYISTIMAKPLADVNAEMVAYMNEEIDLLGISDRSANRYRKYGVTNVEEYMTQYYDCLVPNLYVGKNSKPKFIHDVKARQAIAYALNKSQIISKALINHAVATDVPLPPDSWLFDVSLKIYENNKNQAIQLLEELGYTEFGEDGFRVMIDEETGEVEPLSIEIMYPKEINDSYKINIASLIEEQLESIGINVELRELNSSVFETKIRAGSFDIALMTFFIDRNPDVKFMLHSSKATSNYGYYKDDIMDIAIEACGTALSDEQKKAAFSKVQDIFIKQLPQIPLYFKTNSLIYDYSIKGINDYRSLNIFNDVQSWYVVSEIQ